MIASTTISSASIVFLLPQKTKEHVCVCVSGSILEVKNDESMIAARYFVRKHWCSPASALAWCFHVLVLPSASLHFPCCCLRNIGMLPDDPATCWRRRA
jgi:hypothetical protein